MSHLNIKTCASYRTCNPFVTKLPTTYKILTSSLAKNEPPSSSTNVSLRASARRITFPGSKAPPVRVTPLVYGAMLVACSKEDDGQMMNPVPLRRCWPHHAKGTVQRLLGLQAIAQLGLGLLRELHPQRTRRRRPGPHLAASRKPKWSRSCRARCSSTRALARSGSYPGIAPAASAA